MTVFVLSSVCFTKTEEFVNLFLAHCKAEGVAITVLL